MQSLHVIFDFDGVIGDSLPVLVRIANQQFSHYLHEPLSVESIRTKGVKRFLREYNMVGLRLFLWIWKARRMLGRERVEMIGGMRSLLESLHNKGFLLQLVSSGGREYIERTLHYEHCFQYFHYIHTNIGLFKKAGYIRGLVRGETQRFVYIGDEVRDIEAAHKAGIKCISVSWGYESKNVLQQSNPDVLVDSPEELLCGLESIA